MTDKNGAIDFFNAIKTIVDNYLNNRKVAAIVLGTYNGSNVIINECQPVPLSMITGNMQQQLKSGDKVRMLRNDGGREYYILEITGKPYQIGEKDVEADNRSSAGGTDL